jgi:hypothetical protein
MELQGVSTRFESRWRSKVSEICFVSSPAIELSQQGGRLVRSIPSLASTFIAAFLICRAATVSGQDYAAPLDAVFHGEKIGIEAVAGSQPTEVKRLARESAPEDMNLKGMASWALNYLIHNPRKHLDYECRFNVFPLYCPPTILGHDPVTFGDTDVRMDWEFMYMRDISGVTAGMDSQEGVRKRILGYRDDKNLSSFPYGKGEVGFEAFKKLGPDKSIPFSIGGEKIPSFWSTGKTMVALAETYLRTGDEEAKKSAREIFVALKEMAHWKDGLAFYDTKEILGGMLVEVFVRYWEITKDPEALDLALAFGEWIRRNSGINEDGSHGGHSHTTMHMVWGVAHLGLVTHSPLYIEWAKRVFDFMRRRGTDYGFMPAAFGDPNVLHFSETCATSDMVSIACCVAEAGHPDYWGHAERFVRNYIRESQFFITPEYIEHYRSLNKDKPEEVKAGIAMMKELEGGFLGTVSPNDLTVTRVSHFGGGPDYMLLWGCCAPEGMRTLYTVWKKIVTETDEGIFVNMHINRETVQAKVVSFLPHTGRLTAQANTGGDFFLRAPSWAPRDTIKAYRNGEPVEVVWGGPARAYLKFAKAWPTDELTITYPIIKFTQKIVIGEEPIKQPYSIEWLGNMVTGMTPKGPYLPMFTNTPRPLPEYEPFYAVKKD